jgi:hypothetical protein
VALSQVAPAEANGIPGMMDADDTMSVKLLLAIMQNRNPRDVTLRTQWLYFSNSTPTPTVFIQSFVPLLLDSTGRFSAGRTTNSRLAARGPTGTAAYCSRRAEGRNSAPNHSKLWTIISNKTAEASSDEFQSTEPT